MSSRKFRPVRFACRRKSSECSELLTFGGRLLAERGRSVLSFAQPNTQELVEIGPLRRTSALQRMPMMPRFVLTLAMAVWTSDEVGRAERTLSLCKVGKQVQDRVAMLAGNDDVPGASLWLDGHGELLSVGVGTWRRWRTRVVGSVFQA